MMVNGLCPVGPITIEIRRYYINDYSTNHLIFTGIVSGWSREFQQLYLKCVSRGYELRRSIPNKYFQPYCNHVLFDTNCGLDKADYKMQIKISRPIAGDDGATTFLDVSTFSQDSFADNFGDKALGYFTNGYLEYGNNRYFIANHVSISSIELQFRINFPSTSTGMVVTIYPGCDFSPATCVARYNNLVHFLGFPYIPGSEFSKEGEPPAALPPATQTRRQF